jgi:phosphoribosylformylglycinamidine synthase subunit PurSL
VGGDPYQIGGVDNFCWPTIQYHPNNNPDGKFKAAQLVRSNWALRDYCIAYGIPLLSGKDSMYIDGNLEGPFGERRKVSGLPTLLFTVSSIVKDIRKCVTMDAKKPGDIVYILGETRDELGAGEYYQMMGEVGLKVPWVDVNKSWPMYLSVNRAIEAGLASSVHAVSRGGLAIHLAMVAMAGETGMEISLADVPSNDDLTDSRALYSESSGRFIVTVDPARQGDFEQLFSGMTTGRVGVVSGTSRFRIKGRDGDFIIDEEVGTLKDCWKRPFGGLI